jgi:hypothetical protein
MISLQVLRLNEIETLTSDRSFKEAVNGLKIDKKTMNDLQEKRQNIYSNVCNIAAEQAALAIT